MTARKRIVRDEPVVTTTMFTEAERQAWWVACQRELPVSAADVRAIVAEAVAAERERIRLALFGCMTCGQIHQPHPRPPDPRHPDQAPGYSWAAADGHPYRSRHVGASTYEREAITRIIDGEQP